MLTTTKLAASILFSIILMVQVDSRANYILDRPSVIFRNMGVDQGLAHSQVLAVHQDANGRIWIGTVEGLNSYDGVVVKQFDKQSSNLTSDVIRAITTTSNNTLWIATDDGLHYLSVGASDFKKFDLVLDGYSIKYITNLLVDGSDYLWVAHEKGIFTIASDGQTAVVPILRDIHIRSLGKDSKSRIWAGSNNGEIYRFDSKNDTTPIKVSLNKMTPVRALVNATDDQMWIGTYSSGLYILNTESLLIEAHQITGGSTLLRSNEIRTILKTENGTICVGTARGLAIFNPTENKYQTYTSNSADYRSLAHNIVLHLFEDATGLIWVSTYLGVSVWQDTTNYLTTINRSNEPGLPDNNVTSFALPRNSEDIWIGTLNGLAKWDSEKGYVVDHSSLLVDGRISSLEVDHQNNLWVGTFESGITVVKADGSTMTYTSSDGVGLPSNAITSIKTDHHGRVWVAIYNSGVIYFDGENFQSLESYITNNATTPTNPTNLEADSTHLWIGTIGQGLFGIDLSSHSITQAIPDEPDSIISIWPTDSGKLWLGTWNNGIYLYDIKEQKMVEHFTMADGLSSNGIYGIVEADGNNIWVSSGHGLDLLNIENRIARHYGRDKGAQHDDFNSNAFAKTEGNIILFGGANGFNAFLGTESNARSEGPPIAITTIKGEGNLLYELRTKSDYIPLELDHNINDIDFEMAILDYTNPDNNLYQYRLFGYDNVWQTSTYNHASYTNLDPGSYNFEFKGSVGDRIWTASSLTTPFTIKNPPWLTYPAYFFYLLLTAIIIWLVRLYIQNRMKLANVEHLELLVEERTSELSEILSEKELLLKEIHHRVKNNMQLVSSLLTIQAKTIDDESIKSMFRMCQGRIQTMALIHESLYKSDNLKSIDINEYISALTTNLSHFQQHPGLPQPSIELIVDTIIMDIDIAIVCGLIVNELVTNSLKHAFRKSHVNPLITVSLTASEFSYKLRVTDNGSGIDNIKALESPTTMGFSIISVLATHQLEGQIILNNEFGTSIEIIFPRDD